MPAKGTRGFAWARDPKLTPTGSDASSRGEGENGASVELCSYSDGWFSFFRGRGRVGISGVVYLFISSVYHLISCKIFLMVLQDVSHHLVRCRLCINLQDVSYPLIRRFLSYKMFRIIL